MDFASLGLERFDRPIKSLYRRCVQCAPGIPSCPTCAPGYACAFQIGTCDSCAKNACIPNLTSSASTNSNSVSSAGPIAGGVIGGIAVIGLITFLVWRFCIRNRRQAYDENEWPPEDENHGMEKGMDQFSLREPRSRTSTHTVGSIASTVYTRASNIIQIAYIPGVTNRSPDLVPPVPPIPAASLNGSVASTPHIPGEDQHFFLPSNLRDSAYSGFSNRTSMVRNSVATTIYQNNAIVSPVPAQTVTRAKAVPVSVRSQSVSGKNSPSITSRAATPPLPTMPLQVQDQRLLHSQSSIVGRIAVPRSVTVTRSGSRRSPPAQIHELSGDEPMSGDERSGLDATPMTHASPFTNNGSTFDDTLSEEESSPVAGQSLLPLRKRHSEATTVFQDDSPISNSGSFGSPVSAITPLVGSKPPRLEPHKKSPSLSQIIEEATRKAANEPRHAGFGGSGYKDNDQESGPFSDSHIVEAP